MSQAKVPPAMEQRLSLVTLGVRDVPRAKAFYEALGWHAAEGPPGIAFFQGVGMVVALWGRSELAADSAVEDTGGWGGVTLAHNARTPDDVDRILEAALAAGAALGRSAAPTAWGGYSGVFLDPDGHPWEVAHNPGWAIDEGGAVTLGS